MSPAAEPITQAVERVFRQEYGRILATLIRVIGDFDVAEVFEVSESLKKFSARVWGSSLPAKSDASPTCRLAGGRYSRSTEQLQLTQAA